MAEEINMIYYVIGLIVAVFVGFFVGKESVDTTLQESSCPCVPITPAGNQDVASIGAMVKTKNTKKVGKKGK